MCSHIKKIENILNRIFILLPESCPGVGPVGARGSKTLAWGFAMAPHRLRALVFELFSLMSTVSYSCFYCLTDGQAHNGHRPITIVHLDPSAQVS